MKSLEERKAFRKKQREENAKKEAESGNKQNAGDNSSAGFDSTEYLNRSGKDIEAGLGQLSNEQLQELSEAEGGKDGKKRNNVSSAIKAEQKRRQDSSSGWSAGAQ